MLKGLHRDKSKLFTASKIPGSDKHDSSLPQEMQYPSQPGPACNLQKRPFPKVVFISFITFQIELHTCLFI